ncbi:MAG TPA: choice-of-anchor D domain-containing protein [Bryobacteraceae bacterium]|nr:choice-of-anchor D domain-containing protein [Bryobacteraceae bacterium]
MSVVVVAGSNNDHRFAVIDFTNPASPVNTLTPAPFLGGCMVDCSGTLAAVANFNGSEVVIYDISSPAAPVQKGLANTMLGGIGAISFDGSHVLAGELNGQRIVFIDVTNPSSPVIKSTFTSAVDSISAIALKGTLAVASGPNNLYFAALNYTNPSSPTQVTFTPGTGGVFFGGQVTCDLDGSHAALADGGDGDIYLFNVSGGVINFLGKFSSTQSGIFSISISGNIIAAASSNDVFMTIADFTNPSSPSGTDTNAGLAGGVVVKLSGNFLAAGAILGTDVTLFSVAGTTATALGTANTMLASIATLGMTNIVPVTPEPKYFSTTTSLSYGAVRVNTSSAPQAVTFKNNGTAALNITQLKTSISQYVVAPSGNLAAIPPSQSTTVHVTFTPTAVQSYPATLTMATNDPTNPTVTIPISGSGGLPHMVVPGPLNFGNVAICLSHALNATVGNTGTVDLHLTGIHTTGAGYSASITTLTVPAGGTANIPVTLKPTVTGPLPGTLTFLSDDPNTPTAAINLTGTGTPEPPPSISISPSSINFGAVPLQYFVGIAVTVSNVGPCEDLHVTLTVAGAAFLLTTGDPTTLPMANPPISDTIAASTSKNYTVVFAPTAIGAAGGTLTITSDDPAHPSVTVPLSGNGVTVSPAAIELVLDRSGSMATPITGGTRMDALHSAVSMFSQLVIPGTGFSIGSVQFDTTEAVLTPLANFDATQQTTIINDANSLTPRNLTSIGGGLQLAQTSLTPSSIPRKVAIVFTDGYENTPPLIATVEPSVLSAGTQVYAVGLGDPAYLSVAALSQLAASSNGKFFQTTDPLVLRKQFVEVLADAFQQNMAADPILTLQQGVPVTIPVSITNCESRISFVLLWEDPTAQIQFTVQAPDGTTFGSNSGANNRLVRYVQSPGYRFLQITLPPGPTHTIGPKQLGTWLMKIDPVFVNGGTTRASTNVLVEGELQIAATVSATVVGAPISLAARLLHSGSVVTGAHVVTKLTSPLNSLAQLSTPAVVHRAAAADKHHIPPALQILTKTVTKTYEARFNKREYVFEVPAPAVDGVHHVEVTATGNACGGTFERYWSASFYVGPRAKRGNIAG